MSGFVLWQRIEGGAMLLAALWLLPLARADIPLWALIPIFLAPDLSFAAYLLGPKVGAFAYNLVHLYAFGAVLAVAGLVLGHPALAACGALWLAHSGFDRMLGYGLKSAEGFTVTHLGHIGKAPGP